MQAHELLCLKYENELEELSRKVDVSDHPFWYESFFEKIMEVVLEEAPYLDDELDIESYVKDWWEDYWFSKNLEE